MIGKTLFHYEITDRLGEGGPVHRSYNFIIGVYDGW